MDAGVVLPKRRLNFSVAMKQQAIAWIRGPGAGSPALAVPHFRSLNWEVTIETLEKWWKNRDKIMGAASVDVEPRWALLSAAEELTLATAIRRRARKVRVSAKWITLAVRQMYPAKATVDFNVSKVWLHGFTLRHGLVLVGSNVETASSDVRRRAAPVAKKSQRSMSLHDVLYEEKPAVAVVA